MSGSDKESRQSGQDSLAARKSPTQSRIASNLYKPTISSQSKQHNFINSLANEPQANPYDDQQNENVKPEEKKEHRSEFSFSQV